MDQLLSPISTIKVKIQICTLSKQVLPQAKAAIQNRNISTRVDLNLATDHQVPAPQTAPAQWDQLVAWTRGWTGAGWWTLCSRRR